MANLPTDLAARREVPGPKRREVPDGKVSGLYLVIQPSGAKSWAYRYRTAGRPRKLTIGSFPTIGLASARSLANRAAGSVAEGGDPGAAKSAQRDAAKAAAAKVDDLVEAVVADFIALYAKKKTRDWRESERLLKKDVVAAWRGRRLLDIERKHVVKLLDDIIERGAPIGANRVFAQLRKMCSWAVTRGALRSNPCDGVEAPSPETARDRVLTADELSLVWRAAGALSRPYAASVRMLMLTGARRDEVAGLSWAELNLDEAAWALPAARSKNRREHIVPLSAPVVDLLSQQVRVEDSPFVFGGGRAPLGNFAKAKDRLDAEVTKLNRGQPIPHWTLHDIRRSVATNLQRLGVRLEVTEAVLNHVSGSRAGIVGVYQRHDFAAEKREALDSWARRLDTIVA